MFLLLQQDLAFPHNTLPDLLTVLIGGKPEKSQEGARLILLFTEQLPSKERLAF